jgi:hypothetical protein
MIIQKHGDKFLNDAIILAVGIRGFNKSFRNNSLVVRQPIGTPWFQAQEH